MRLSELVKYIEEGGYDSAFAVLYGKAAQGRDRALGLCADFSARFGDRDGVALFSSPGRTELIGNHTDHNGGLAVAAAIDLDILALAAPEEGKVEIYEGERHTLAPLDGVAEKGTSEALAHGMAARLGGGFVACTDSRIPYGMGLSSSAAFSLLCGKIADFFHGDGEADYLKLAFAARDAENLDFGKKCGLLDQIACAHGGTVQIDFGTEVPTVTPMCFTHSGFALYLVDTKESHAGDDGKYAAICDDMKAAAGYFGADRLADVSVDSFNDKKERLRLKLGERVYRRAQHFFDENKRVGFFCRRAALGQTANCLYAVNGSGISSRTNLGNVHAAAVEATEALKDIAAAIRIHGGGFGGALQCYVPVEKEAAFKQKMEGLFGKDCCIPVRIREIGACAL